MEFLPKKTKAMRRTACCFDLGRAVVIVAMTWIAYSLPAFCQQLNDNEGNVPLLSSPVPHPYVSFGPSLMGGGYAPLAARAEVGLDLESSHILVLALAAYDNGHKTHDNDQPNRNGHDKYLRSSIYWRLSNRWFFGGGWRWNALSTTNYTKKATRPTFGGGFDYFLIPCERCPRDFSMRATIDYVLPGSDWQNGVQGPEISMTMPSPREKRHWFYVERLGVYKFHTTVTDPTNIQLTRWQRAHWAVTSDAEFGIAYRF